MNHQTNPYRPPSNPLMDVNDHGNWFSGGSGDAVWREGLDPHGQE